MDTLQTKKNYSTMTLEEAMHLIGSDRLSEWHLDAPPLPPSETLREVLRRLQYFDLSASEPAKVLLIDALFIEIIPRHEKLKIWKEAPLNTDVTTGYVDYLIAPNRAYLATPLLCVAEAKKDDFLRGQIQCLAEMAACRICNQQRGISTDIYGIVSNGQGWQFYRLTKTGNVSHTAQYGIEHLNDVLGALDYIFRECAANVP